MSALDFIIWFVGAGAALVLATIGWLEVRADRQANRQFTQRLQAAIRDDERRRRMYPKIECQHCACTMHAEAWACYRCGSVLAEQDQVNADLMKAYAS